MRNLMPPRLSRSAGLRFRAAQTGVAAVEFALVLPILLAIFVGMSEYAHAIDTWRKLTLLARTVSDLTSQGDTQNPISATLMSDILSASAAVMRPLDAGTTKVVVSAMGVMPSGALLIPKVCTSVANANGTRRVVGNATDLTVPPGFQTAGMRYVLTEVSMAYRPMLGSALVKLFGDRAGTINLRVSIPWPTRGGAKVNANAYTEVVLPDPSTTSPKPC